MIERLNVCLDEELGFTNNLNIQPKYVISDQYRGDCYPYPLHNDGLGFL